MLCALCILLYILLLFLFTACLQNGQDDPDDPGFEEGIPTEVQITLSTRSCNGTRADRDGEDRDPTSSIELMHDNWWIVFVSKKVIKEDDKNVPDVKIFTRNNVTDKITSTPSSVNDPNGGYEAETFKIIIPSGTYRIYAFANVPQKTEEEFKALLEWDSKNNKWKHKAANIGDFIGIDRFINDSMQWPVKRIVDGIEVDNNIPMTGVMPEQVIRNTMEEALNIEVIRAVAKVEFAFSKSSDDNIVVKELKFGPLTCNYKVSFVPNNDSIGFGPNDKLNRDDIKTGTITFDNNDKNNLSLTDDPLNKYNMGLFSFYCKESLPKPIEDESENEDESQTKKLGGPFTIKLTVDKNGTTKTKTLYTKKITYINRNDWIRIPIEFSDWKVYWKLRAYPPIGGYPPVFEQDEEGTTLSAKVTTGGEFELYPTKITKGSDTTNHADKIDWEKASVSVLSGEQLFIKPPTLESDPNNPNAKIIVGELDPKVKVEAKVKIDFVLDETVEQSTLYSCIFTINPKNSAP